MQLQGRPGSERSFIIGVNSNFAKHGIAEMNKIIVLVLSVLLYEIGLVLVILSSWGTVGSKYSENPLHYVLIRFVFFPTYLICEKIPESLLGLSSYVMLNALIMGGLVLLIFHIYKKTIS